VDIDNDGAADDGVVWKPIDMGCGFEQNGSHWRTSTKLILLDKAGELDVPRTRAVFAHPRGQEQVFIDAKARQVTRIPATFFREFGDKLGVFRYAGSTYVDTFYSDGGDLKNERSDQPALANTLAVLKRGRDGLELKCEILWQSATN
jgi:hypothetical protein